LKKSVNYYITGAGFEIYRITPSVDTSFSGYDQFRSFDLFSNVKGKIRADLIFIPFIVDCNAGIYISLDIVG
jgi:hypothetical protein